MKMYSLSSDKYVIGRLVLNSWRLVQYRKGFKFCSNIDEHLTANIKTFKYSTLYKTVLKLQYALKYVNK